MGRLYTIQPDDLEPIEFTHFDCWDDDTMESIVESWSKNLGIFINTDSWESVIMSLLRNGYDVYEGDEFIEIYEGKYND